MPRLMPRGRTCGGSSTLSAGLVCVCPICARWAAQRVRLMRCSWWITPWPASLGAIRCVWVPSCRSRRSTVCAPVRLLASSLPLSVARSQLKRHRVDAAAECAHALIEGCGLAALDLSSDEAEVLERGLDTLDTRMQAHFDRARALAEYLAANEMVSNVRYPGLSLASRPCHCDRHPGARFWPCS